MDFVSAGQRGNGERNGGKRAGQCAGHETAGHRRQRINQDWRNRARGNALGKEKCAAIQHSASIHWLAGENPLARPVEAMASDQARYLRHPSNENDSHYKH
ncbi:hypothetical protein ACN9M1_11120 [Ralstonia sp. R-29]|uniref:hypothetical protein n=1 Tax=Ralstonia sp. R-29 TaxID=3404059 RepID=UPI003CF53EA3